MSLSGVSCPQVHDHSDLMCTVSVVSREGHKDLGLKVGLPAMKSGLSILLPYLSIPPEFFQRY